MSTTTQPTEVPWTQPNGIYATYDLHCHCGAIKYQIKLSPPLFAEQTEGKEQCVAVECDCSWCARHGIWAVHPLAEDVEFTQGLNDRVSYYFATKKNPQWICRHCGSALGTDLTYLMEEVFKAESRCTINVWCATLSMCFIIANDSLGAHVERLRCRKAESATSQVYEGLWASI